MPTNRKRIRRPSQAESWVSAYYLHGYKGEGRRALLYGSDEPLNNWPWTEAREELLPKWIRENPCTRPYMWWEVDAPEPRRRVGGTGRRKRHTILNFGIPAPNTGFRDVDPAWPPIYESEAAYLPRHNLFTTSEKKWLADHPEALEPVAIEYRLET